MKKSKFTEEQMGEIRRAICSGARSQITDSRTSMGIARRFDPAS